MGCAIRGNQSFTWSEELCSALIRPSRLLHLQLSLNRQGRWGTTDDFITSPLYLSLFSTALRTPGLSIPWYCLPNSSSVCPVFFSLSLCALQDGSGQTGWTGDTSIPLQFTSLNDGQVVFVWSDYPHCWLGVKCQATVWLGHHSLRCQFRKSERDTALTTAPTPRFSHQSVPFSGSALGEGHIRAPSHLRGFLTVDLETVSKLVGAVSPVNHIGLHQSWTKTSIYLQIIHSTSHYTTS